MEPLFAVVENAPLLSRRRGLIRLVEAATAVEILDLSRAHIVTLEKRIEIMPGCRARDTRLDVLCMDVAIECFTPCKPAHCLNLESADRSGIEPGAALPVPRRGRAQ